MNRSYYVWRDRGDEWPREIPKPDWIVEASNWEDAAMLAATCCDTSDMLELIVRAQDGDTYYQAELSIAWQVDRHEARNAKDFLAEIRGQ